MLAFLCCFDFENEMEMVISHHLNFNSMHHDKCKFAVTLIPLIPLATISNLLSLLVYIQNCQHCQLCVLLENSIMVLLTNKSQEVF